MRMYLRVELIVGETTVLMKTIPLDKIKFDNFKIIKEGSSKSAEAKP